MTKLKRCTKCGEDKPATVEFFARDGRRENGLAARCKTCDKKYRFANKASTDNYNRTYYVTRKERLNEQARSYHAAHKERLNEQSRSYYAAHKERLNKLNKAYYIANKDHLNRQKHIYYVAHKEHLAEQNRRWRAGHGRELLELGRAWRANNQEKVRANHHRRRALKRNAEGSHTAEDIQTQLKRQKRRCYYCRVKVGDTYHVDHIVPLIRGGSDNPENLVITCPHCNRSKNNKLPHEWPQGNRLI